MWYFKKNNNEIIKYEVKINKEELENLRENIINQCSIRRIVKTNPLPIVCSPKGENIKFVTSKLSFTREDFYGNTDYYTFEYVEYEYPKIIKYIDLVLDGNINAIDYLLMPPKEEKIDKIKCLEEKIEKYSKNVFDTNYLEEMQKLLLELEKEKKTVEINKNNLPVETYYESIRETITLNELERIDRVLVDKVNSFFNEEGVIKKLKER